jgi:tyrosinase
VSELHVDGTFVEPADEKETPATPLAPFRRALHGQSEPTWWKSTDVRDYRSLGYDYPQTAAARQTGDLAAGLTAWANTELGWAVPPGSGDPGQPDQQALVHLKQQITEPIQALPSQILLDGTTPLNQGEEYISSSAQAVATEPSKIQTQSVLSAIAKPAQAAMKMVSPRKDVAQKSLKSALPAHKPGFNDRFGGLGDLVSQGKMTQWNASFGVDK